ncbi:MAG TPA: hypothetical protein VEC99_11645 [Clostridia bacterium]|nr:hypothetical protein [Clostridia bacterium]
MSEILNAETAQLSAVRLLRCQETQRYYTGEGWTDNPTHAQPFPNEEEAVRACSSHDLHKIELVLRDPVAGKELSARPIR